MLRSLFSTASIFVLLVPTLISPASAAAARRCDVEPPQTLLSLYRNSDSIHIGQLDRIEEGTITESTEDYTVVDIKKHFSISSTLKGDSRKFFTLDEKDYRYKNQENTEEEEHGEDMEGAAETLEPGDSVILFLKKGEGEDAKIEVSHWRDSIKKLDRDELGSYEQRLRELNGIFGAKKVSDEAIVRWLVEASRDPNTRWEGAYELYQSFQQAGWKKEREEHLAEMRKNGEKIEENVEESDNEPDTSVYSTLLTDGQKAELMNTLLESRSTAEKKPTDRQKRGDGILIELVSRWGDSRFATFLVDRLRSSDDDNWERSSLMLKIAEALKDDELSSISSKYSDVTYQEDDAIVGEGQEGAEPAEAVATDSAQAEVPAENAVEVPAVAKITYKQLRAELLDKFVTRSETVLAKSNKQETAKLSNNLEQ